MNNIIPTSINEKINTLFTYINNLYKSFIDLTTKFYVVDTQNNRPIIRGDYLTIDTSNNYINLGSGDPPKINIIYSTDDISTFISPGGIGADLTIPNGSLFLTQYNNGEVYIKNNDFWFKILIGEVIEIFSIYLRGGTVDIAPINLNSGSLLNVQNQGSIEYDDNLLYFTNNIYDGRGVVPSVVNYKLIDDLPPITVNILDDAFNFFDNDIKIKLSGDCVYDIDITSYFQSSDVQTLHFILNYSDIPSHHVIYIEHFKYTSDTSDTLNLNTNNNVAGYFYNPIYNNLKFNLSVSGDLEYIKIKLFVINSSVNNFLELKVYNDDPAYSITPKAGSYWKSIKLPINNNGTY